MLTLKDCKPCPFCGKTDVAMEWVPPEGEDVPEDERRDYALFAVTCWECNAQTGYFRTDEQAIEAWNRRDK